MAMIKILSVFGTRPEATKMAPLVLAAARQPDMESKVCVTAQHRELLDGVLNPLGITPDYDLNIMAQGQSLADIVCRVLTGLGGVISDARPDLLLVHGDTATTFAAALAAFYAKVRVGHVEAGLRTYDKYQPYPEEMNRRLTAQLADLCFAPTAAARENLLKENIPDAQIFVTGNTAIDFIAHTAQDGGRFTKESLNALDFSRRIVVLTAHRSENRHAPMEAICRAARRIADGFADVTVVWPLHPNPLVADTARRFLSGHPRIVLTEHIGVFDMHRLLRRACLVMTDSGGLQEEAPAFNLPVVVLRNVTERPEGLAAGTLVLAGTDETRIVREVSSLLTDPKRYAQMANARNPFGDGRASERILAAIRYAGGLSQTPPVPFGAPA